MLRILMADLELIHCLKTWHRRRLCDHSSSGWRLIYSQQSFSVL